MGGGLLQLVAYGAQDVYLTGSPQITFFKVVYRRHTNFAMEAIQQTFNGSTDLGRRVTCQVSRNGDLIHKMYLKFSFTTHASEKTLMQPYYALRMIKNVELEIGGQRIDKQYAEWMYVWNELSLPAGKKEGYKQMVGAAPGNYNNSAQLLKTGTTYTHYVPLEFWFCRNVGLALPLIALQYHEVKINLELAQTSEIMVASSDTNNYFDFTANPPALSADTIANDVATGWTVAAALPNFAVELWVDYIYLDTDERRRFAQMSHEYLIDQLQFTGTDTITAGVKNYRMNFNHPTKELIWFVHNAGYWTKYSDSNGLNPVTSAKMQLNGNDRFSERSGDYFSLVQPYQHHTNVPNPMTNNGINVYSFGLKPEEHQPSGTLNMSRIDTASLMITSFC
eukprot:762478-Hanusia_phi.AAC.6